jgi:hypothetical protein
VAHFCGCGTTLHHVRHHTPLRGCGGGGAHKMRGFLKPHPSPLRSSRAVAQIASKNQAEEDPQNENSKTR